MFLFETRIFDKFFSSFDKRWDSNKDVNNKGTLERFNECIGKDLDEELVLLIENLLKNIRNPETALDRYIPFLESMTGFRNDPRTEYNLYLSSSIDIRRKVVKHISKYYAIRGTIRLYTILFGMLGITMVLTEHDAGYGLDSPYLLDDPDRTLDNTVCPPCTDYSLALTGPAITLDLQTAINSIISFNEPINARLRALTYNGVSAALGDFNDDYNADFFI